MIKCTDAGSDTEIKMSVWGDSYNILSYDVASESALKMIIHWWIKYANYVVRLGVDVQKKTSRFLMAKSGRFSAKLAYKRRFKSYDKWSLAFVHLCCWIYWGCWGKPIGCSAGILVFFPNFQ